MATVSGLTKERMLEIEAKCIIDGAVDLSGNLVLETRDGTRIEAGNLKGPKGDQGPPASPLTAWPVGTIFMNVTSTSPSLLLGGGTWVRWGQGRVPIGVYEADGRFDQPEEAGGVYDVALSWGQMPQHYHGVNDGGHVHDTGAYNQQVDARVGGGLYLMRRGGLYGENVATSYANVSIQNAGNNEAHTNVQPYLTVYMWKRTA